MADATDPAALAVALTLANAAAAVESLAAERDRLAARVAELEAGLKPFAAVGECVFPGVDDRTQEVLAVPRSAPYLTAGDFRRAAELLAPASPEAPQ
jgi:hypothetical protein